MTLRGVCFVQNINKTWFFDWVWDELELDNIVTFLDTIYNNNNNI